MNNGALFPDGATSLDFSRLLQQEQAFFAIAP
jgi:hypothetical protein